MILGHTDIVALTRRRNAKLLNKPKKKKLSVHIPKLLLFIIYLDPQQTKATAALPGVRRKQGHGVTQNSLHTLVQWLRNRALIQLQYRMCRLL